MIQSAESPTYEVLRLARTPGLRVWAEDHTHCPEAATQLLRAANRMDIVPHVLLLGVDEDSHDLVNTAAD